MAIKLNGVTISSNKLNGGNVTVEKLNGTVVYTTTLTLQWQFVHSSSSEPASSTYDVFTSQSINGDYELGLEYLNFYYPANHNYDGFVAVIYDYSSQEYFTFVIVYD